MRSETATELEGLLTSWIDGSASSRALVATTLFAATFPIFSAIGARTVSRYDFGLPLDGLIPLLPWTVVVYASYLLVVPVSAAVLRPQQLRPLLTSIAFVFVAACGVFCVLPAEYPRPDLRAVDAPLVEWLAWVYANDAAGNTLPSLHVAVTCLCLGHVWRVTRRAGYLVWAAAICTSTMTVKQHFFLDVVSGAALGLGAVWLGRRRIAARQRPTDAPCPRAPTGRGIPARLNLALALALCASWCALHVLAARQESTLGLLAVGVIFALMMAPNYSLMHEAFHGVLHPRRAVNDALGFLLTAWFPGPYSFMQACHLGHHRRNRTDAEMFDLCYPGESLLKKRAQFYSLYLGGFWALPVVSLALLAIAPRLMLHRAIQDVPAARAMLGGIPRRYALRIRVESWATLLVHALAWIALDLRWQSYALLYACHAVWWSAHNFLAHYGSPRDVKNGAFDIALPRWASAALLHFNWHLAHHQHPGTPWLWLPHHADPTRRPVSYLHALSRFWRGPRVTNTPSPRELPPRALPPGAGPTPAGERLRGEVARRGALPEATRARLWQLFRQYYDQVDEAAFFRDLDEKSHVILVRNRQQQVVGFSTLLLERHRVESSPANVLFSGDTVVDERYWGDKSLHKAFVRFLIGAKIRAPLVPLYWLLLTKGYKTYLLLTRNFPTHFPSRHSPTPRHVARLIDRVCRRRYGSAWRAPLGIVRFERSHGQLKRGAACIEPTQLIDPDIAFFAEHNPGHLSGDELACAGVASWWMFLRFALRLTWRAIRRRRSSTRARRLPGEAVAAE